jgi:cytochrome c peroxidase
MHDGSQKTLSDVIDFYDGGFVSRKSLSPHVKRLNLGKHEKADLLAFLNSLTSDNKPIVLPDLPQGNS